MKPGKFGDKLSQKELDIVRLAGEGLCCNSTAVRMKLSRYTINDYRRRAMAKLGAADIANCVGICYRTGLLPVEMEGATNG